MDDLTGLQRDILCIIAGLDEPTQRLIHHELDDYHPDGVHPTRVLPNLKVLLDKGLIAPENRHRDTVLYRTTDYGDRVIATRHDWEDAQYSGDPTAEMKSERESIPVGSHEEVRSLEEYSEIQQTVSEYEKAVFEDGGLQLTIERTSDAGKTQYEVCFNAEAEDGAKTRVLDITDSLDAAVHTAWLFTTGVRVGRTMGRDD